MHMRIIPSRTDPFGHVSGAWKYLANAAICLAGDGTGPCDENPFQVWLDANLISDAWNRVARKDRFEPRGMDGPVVRSLIFHNVKLPQRAVILALTCMGEKVAWAGYRPRITVPADDLHTAALYFQ